MPAKAPNSGDKPAKKKPSGGKNEKKPRRLILTKELNALIRLLDEKSIEFLKHQAEVLLHNSRIEEVKKKAALLAEKSSGSGKAKHATAGVPRMSLPAQGFDVRVEKVDHNYFNVYVGKNRIFFNREEFKHLAKICHASSTISEATTRLYRWFERERKDFLNDAEIERAGTPALAALYDIIIKHYHVKEG